MRIASRPLALLAPLLAAFAAAACTLTHDLGDLTRGEGDSGSSEPGSNDDAGSGDDASVSGNQPGANPASAEAGTIADAHDEAPAQVEVNDVPKFVDAGSFCADGGATFCADFDRTPLPSGFAGTEGTYLALTSSRASSAPNDLLLVVPAMASNGVYASKVSQDFQVTASTVSFSFDIYPQRTTDDGALLIAALDYLTGTKYSIRFAYFAGQLRVEESFLGAGPIDRYHASFDVPKMTWSRVRLDLAFGGDGGIATEGVSVNGQAVGGKETLAPPAGVVLKPTLHVGAVYGVGPQSGWELRFDNVALDLH